jgi:hypothetical protein
MIADAFITFGPLNIFFIGCGVVCLILAAASTKSKDMMESNYGPAVPLMLLVLAILVGVASPHWHTDNLLHGPQARADFRQDYGPDTKIDKMSLIDHWAVAEIAGCGQPIRAEMRMINGHYWFAYGVQKKDKNGESYTDHAPIGLHQLLVMCGQVKASTT